MSRVTVSDADTGRACPYCRFPLKSGVVAEQCDACGALHHEDCWSDNVGCAVLGCANSSAVQRGPDAISAQKAAKSAPAVIPPTGQAPPTAPDQPSQNRSNNVVILAAAGILAVAVIAVALLVVVNGQGDDATTASASTDTPSSESAVEGEPEIESESDSLVARKVVRVLHEYETAYSNEDRGGLSSIFSPTIQRWGVNGSDSCSHDTGKHAVLEAYQSQFDENGSLTYTLVSLSADQVDRVSETRARVQTSYSISNGQAAPISFSFERGDSGDWRISRVKVGTCA